MSQNCHGPLTRDGASNLLNAYTDSHLSKVALRSGNPIGSRTREDDLV